MIISPCCWLNNVDGNDNNDNLMAESVHPQSYHDFHLLNQHLKQEDLLHILSRSEQVAVINIQRPNNNRS